MSGYKYELRKDLLEEINRLVGREHRNEFMVQAVKEQLAREKRQPV